MKKVLVVDLDGSLYSINTFHFFITYLIRHSIRRIDVSLFCLLVYVIGLRGLKIISHSKMKYIILNSIKSKEQIGYKKFVSSISKYKREIEAIKNNFDLKILATAAPSCYASIIAKNEQFHTCLGTNFPTKSFHDRFENIKEEKKENVMNYLVSQNITKIDTFITDHLDDLPLIKLANRNIIVSPSQDFMFILKQNLISFDVIM